MKIFSKILVFIIVLMLILAVIALSKTARNGLLPEQPQQTGQLLPTNEKTPIGSGNKQAHTTASLQPEESVRAKPEQPRSDDATPVKIAYDDDWCIAVSDLNQQDLAYYLRELGEWNLTRGRISPQRANGHGNASSQFLVPYMESSTEAIWQQIQNDNAYAMIATLGREDFDFESVHNIAQRLLIKGYTSAALPGLTTYELLKAKILFQQTGQVNTDIEAHLHRAMAYITYGIRQHDISAAQTYFHFRWKDYPPELKPTYALGADNRIQEYLDSLTQWIDETRANENLQLPTTDELPKAAKHDFESSLARLHLEFGSELNDLKGVLPDTTSTLLEGSECVHRQVEFIGNLERRARSRVR